SPDSDDDPESDLLFLLPESSELVDSPPQGKPSHGSRFQGEGPLHGPAAILNDGKIGMKIKITARKHINIRCMLRSIIPNLPWYVFVILLPSWSASAIIYFSQMFMLCLGLNILFYSFWFAF